MRFYLLFLICIKFCYEVEAFEWVTSWGAPVYYNQRSPRVSRDIDQHDLILFLLQEKIPERVAHAKGSGAFGYFQVTSNNISSICKARLFSDIGKKTPVAVRFSTESIGSSGIDTVRDIRGFAIKFYTEDGNFDLVGANTPVFAMKDPFFFCSFIHSLKPDPVSNLIDFNMRWDLATLRPETFHLLLYIYSDYGIPKGFRFMPGFSVHTYQVVNDKGESHFIRFHLIPNEGIRNLSTLDARKIASYDPDYYVRDLFNAINSGNFPIWKVFVQVLSMDDIRNSEINPFDVTLLLPLDKYPLHEIGEIVLNRNARNYFAEIEQLAFSPSNLVPGILGAPDKLFETRMMAYKEAQAYRLGINHNNIPVNQPLNSAFTYHQGGYAPHSETTWKYPNYFPNSFGGPVYRNTSNETPIIDIIEDDQVNNFNQAADLYVNFNEGEQTRLVDNIVESLSCTHKFIQKRAITLFNQIHVDLGRRVDEALSTSVYKNIVCPGY